MRVDGLRNFLYLLGFIVRLVEELIINSFIINNNLQRMNIKLKSKDIVKR